MDFFFFFFFFCALGADTPLMLSKVFLNVIFKHTSANHQTFSKICPCSFKGIFTPCHFYSLHLDKNVCISLHLITALQYKFKHSCSDDVVKSFNISLCNGTTSTCISAVNKWLHLIKFSYSAAIINIALFSSPCNKSVRLWRCSQIM